MACRNTLPTPPQSGACGLAAESPGRGEAKGEARGWNDTPAGMASARMHTASTPHACHARMRVYTTCIHVQSIHNAACVRLQVRSMHAPICHGEAGCHAGDMPFVCFHTARSCSVRCVRRFYRLRFEEDLPRFF